MMWLVRIALRFPYTFVVGAILIVLLGAVSIRSMEKDVFPAIDVPVVSVIWSYNGVAPAAPRVHYSALSSAGRGMAAGLCGSSGLGHCYRGREASLNWGKARVGTEREACHERETGRRSRGAEYPAGIPSLRQMRFGISLLPLRHSSTENSQSGADSATSIMGSRRRFPGMRVAPGSVCLNGLVANEGTTEELEAPMPTANVVPKEDQAEALALNWVRGFSADQCPRCGGFMVAEWCGDHLGDNGQIVVWALRCVQCGERIDPVILLNRALQRYAHVPCRVQAISSTSIESKGLALGWRPCSF